MINDLDETIRKLVMTHARFDENSVDITFDQPTGDWAAGLTRPTVDFYLYDIRENLELRNQEWTVERRPDGTGAKRMAPLRYSLSYLVTVWTQNQVEDEHAILWRVLAALARHPTMPQELLQGEMRGQPYAILAQTAQPSMAIGNMPDLWGVMENQLRPSLDYVVTVAMDRDVAFTGPLVLTKRIRVGQRGEEAWDQEILQVAGMVRAKDDPQRPMAGAVVRLADLGLETETDAYGRYRFANVPAGEHSMEVVVGGRTERRSIQVPPADRSAPYVDWEV